MNDSDADRAALDLVVARTGHARLREYLDPSRPEYDPRYWRHVRRLAASYTDPPPPAPPTLAPPPPPPPPDPALLALVRQCPDRVNAGRPCRCTWRCRGDGRLVSLEDCLSCVGGGR